MSSWVPTKTAILGFVIVASNLTSATKCSKSRLQMLVQGAFSYLFFTLFVFMVLFSCACAGGPLSQQELLPAKDSGWTLGTSDTLETFRWVRGTSKK